MSNRRSFLQTLIGGACALVIPIPVPKVVPLADPAAVNALLFEKLCGDSIDQAALDAVNGFTRMKMREDGFMRRIIPLTDADISGTKAERDQLRFKPVTAGSSPAVSTNQFS